MNFLLYSAKIHQLRQHRHLELSRGLLNIKTMLAYESYNRPQLEYCVQLWNPYIIIKDIRILEKWESSSKLVKNITTLPFEDRLNVFITCIAQGREILLKLSKS